MSMLAKIFFNFKKQKREPSDKKSRYIFYKIVGSNEDEEIYSLQCISTNAIFHAKLTDIVFDLDILHGLDPVQACYIGIKYAKHLKSNQVDYPTSYNIKKLEKLQIPRYGKYSIYYQNRSGEVCIIDSTTDKRSLYDPRDIALSEELIQEFDAAQAFYIGLLAGLRINSVMANEKDHFKSKNSTRPHLRLVK